jgi:hypothetical protein
MTTAVKQSAGYSDEAVNMKFLEMMPVITKSARIAFAGYNADKRADAVQSVLCWAFMNLKNLAAKGKLHAAFAGPITKYAIGRHYEGRSLGTVTSSTCVMSNFTQSLGRAKTKNYGICENVTDTFESEATAGDGRYPPDRMVQFRLDFFETWLADQSPRDQSIIKDLAMGSTQSEVAKKHGVTSAHIFHDRKRYAKSWKAFIADKKAA